MNSINMTTFELIIVTLATCNFLLTVWLIYGTKHAQNTQANCKEIPEFAEQSLPYLIPPNPRYRGVIRRDAHVDWSSDRETVTRNGQ